MNFLTLITALMSLSVNTQTTVNPAHIPGIYYVQGIRETATGFELHKDSTFEFFFVYGALDRIGSGTWSYRDNKIILNTRKRPAADFQLVESKKITGDKIVVQMAGQNPMILNNVNCVLTTGTETLEESTNQKGKAVFPLQAAKKLSLIFTLCPDRFSDFPMVKDHNFYSFSLQPWITEIFLENYTLNINRQGNFEGKHPILEPKNYLFEKSSEK